MKARRMRSAAPKPASAETASSETAASLVEARALDELRRGEARFGHEVTREAALAHMGAGGERRHREIGARVFHDESADAGKALVLDALGGELRGELGLTAGAHQIHDVMAGKRERHLAAEVFLDQRKREVHARGDAGRRPDVAVADIDRVVLDGNLREALSHRGRIGPVGRRTAAIEHTRGGEDDRAGADGDGAGGARGCLAHEGEEALILHRRPRPLAARNHEGVETGEVRGRDIGERAVRTEDEAAGRGDGSTLLRDEFDLVGGFAGRRIDGGGEELDGARNVEDLGRVIDKHHHAAGRGGLRGL
jgi:hypothetical protein